MAILPHGLTIYRRLYIKKVSWIIPEPFPVSHLVEIALEISGVRCFSGRNITAGVNLIVLTLQPPSMQLPQQWKHVVRGYRNSCDHVIQVVSIFITNSPTKHMRSSMISVSAQQKCQNQRVASNKNSFFLFNYTCTREIINRISFTSQILFSVP